MLDKTVLKLYKPHPNVVDLPKPACMLAMANKLFPKFVPLPTAVGVEVEIERVGNLEVADTHWGIKEDHSLRNNGYELVSKPLIGNALPVALALYNDFLQRNPKSEFSHRCSIHVHIDVTDLTYDQLLSFIAFYISIEDVFFSVYFPFRRGNAYCYPLTSTQIDRVMIQPNNMNEDTWKYAAINLYHLRDYGTVEFRQHPGTKKVQELFDWIQTIADIYKFAVKTPSDKLYEILLELNTTSGYYKYVQAALPNWNYPIDVGMMYDSITAAKFFLQSKDQ